MLYHSNVQILKVTEKNSNAWKIYFTDYEWFVDLWMPRNKTFDIIPKKKIR